MTAVLSLECALGYVESCDDAMCTNPEHLPEPELCFICGHEPDCPCWVTDDERDRMREEEW